MPPHWSMIAGCHLAVGITALHLVVGRDGSLTFLVFAAALAAGIARLWSRHRGHGLGLGEEDLLFYCFPVSIAWYLAWEARRAGGSAVLALLALALTAVAGLALGVVLRVAVALFG